MAPRTSKGSWFSLAHERAHGRGVTGAICIIVGKILLLFLAVAHVTDLHHIYLPAGAFLGGVRRRIEDWQDYGSAGNNDTE